MNILFVNPFITDFSAYDLWLRPVGLLYIAAAVRRYTSTHVYWLDPMDRFSVETGSKSRPDGRGNYRRTIIKKPPLYESVPRHYARYGITWDEFERRLNSLPDTIDLVLITSLMTYWIDGLEMTVGAIRKRYPRAEIVLGGVLAGLVPEFDAGSLGINRVIPGYGESKVLDLISKMGGKVADYPDFGDIDNLPFPAVDLLGSREFLPLLTSRGCPGSCSYCASRLLHPRFSQRSPENVLAEINSHINRFNTSHFIIYDDALLINKKTHFRPIFSSLEKQQDISFHTPNGLHAREIDGETAFLMAGSGFQTVRLSFESTQAEILSRSDNKVNLTDMIRAMENLEMAGYKPASIEVYLLFGYPGQTVADVEHAIRFVRELGARPHLAFYSPVPGTRDFKELQSDGSLAHPTNLYEGNKLYYLYRKSTFQPQEILYLKDLAATAGPQQT